LRKIRAGELELARGYTGGVVHVHDEWEPGNEDGREEK
jgi:hypothetical protein